MAQLSRRVLDDQLNAQLIDRDSPVRLLDDPKLEGSSSMSSGEKRLMSQGISVKDHILEEVKGRDSPMKQQLARPPAKKFSPSKKEYQTTHNKDKVNQQFFFKKIGDSTDSEEEGAGKGGFRLHKID